MGMLYYPAPYQSMKGSGVIFIYEIFEKVDYYVVPPAYCVGIDNPVL